MVQNTQSKKLVTSEKSECIFECECLEDKKYRIVFDSADAGQYFVEYCQKCYDQDDKQFLVSQEELL